MKFKKFSQLNSKQRIVLIIFVSFFTFIMIFSIGSYTGLWAFEPGNGGGYTPPPPPPPEPTITIPNPPVLESIPSPDTDGSIYLKWNVVPDAEGYEVDMSKDDGSWVTIATTTSIATPKSGLTNGVYEFRVRAYNEAGYSPYSGSRYVTVAIPGEEIPGVPEKPVMNQITYEIIEDTIRVYIDWEEVDCDSYNVYKSIDYGEYILIPMEEVLTLTSYSEVLTEVGVYRYKVSAVNTLGESEFSNRVLIEIPEDEPFDYTMIYVLLGVFGVLIVMIVLFRKRIKIKR